MRTGLTQVGFRTIEQEQIGDPYRLLPSINLITILRSKYKNYVGTQVGTYIVHLPTYLYVR